MKTTRKRYTGEFKAKVALEAIRGDLTLAELAAKHGIHPTMIATWKRQAIDGHGGDLLGRWRSGQGRGRGRAREAARQDRPAGGGAGFFVEGVRAMSVERRRQMIERRACQPVDRGAVPAGVDQPVVLLLCAGAGDGGDAGADGGDRRGRSSTTPGMAAARWRGTFSGSAMRSVAGGCGG